METHVHSNPQIDVHSCNIPDCFIDFNDNNIEIKSHLIMKHNRFHRCSERRNIKWKKKKKEEVSHFAFGRLIDIDTCTALLLCHYYDYRFFIISNNALQAFGFPIWASIIHKNEFVASALHKIQKHQIAIFNSSDHFLLSPCKQHKTFLFSSLFYFFFFLDNRKQNHTNQIQNKNCLYKKNTKYKKTNRQQ